MSRKRRQPPSSRLVEDAFLRSINLRYDANEPLRIAHFRPTAKSISLIRRLIAAESERSFFVVAPYGSGKSLTAAYALHLIENRPESSALLCQISRRLGNVSKDLAHFAEVRRRGKSKGLVIALHGHCRSLPEGLRDSVLESMSRSKDLRRHRSGIAAMPCSTIDDAINILLSVRNKAADVSYDRVGIFWDEFGRHLDTLIAEGRPSDLSDVQVLAEFTSRSTNVPIVLALFMHQGLMHYASNMPQLVRSEWAKIEGRFETIQYVENSRELYRLIAEIVSDRTRSDCSPRLQLPAVAQTCKRLGLFRDFTVEELAVLLRQAHPISPVALYLLPRISARVAQNERTLFTFLFNQNLGSRIGGDKLYDYFSAAMRSDTAVGGTHRQWLETESALSKVADDELARVAVKTACLLGVGTSGERARCGRGLLTFAIQTDKNPTQASRTIDNLIERKLLLHRKHSDEVSVWHGTDADLRGRLMEEQRQHQATFDVISFLREHAQAPAWRPTQYNDEFYVRRYLAGRYCSVEMLATSAVDQQSVACDADGRILYVLAETAKEYSEAEACAKAYTGEERTLIAIPRSPLKVTGACLEVYCLLRLQLDPALIESDPLVGPELSQMIDDARGHLQVLLDRLVSPSPLGPRWFCMGAELQIESPSDLRNHLSKVMRDAYGLTPKINNEMIVRRKPTSVVINARKKLLLALLERHGQEKLGIEGDFPDASIFRTVLLNTGLYRPRRGKGWGYAAPNEITDPGLRSVWEKVREFFACPSVEAKKPRNLLSGLTKSPFGVREGVLPILFAAGLKAFPSAISLTRHGEYIGDILPSVIEDISRDPDSYRLAVLEFDDATDAYLRGIHRIFSAITDYEVPELDLIRACYDAVESWKAQLPAAALTTRRISEEARRLQVALSDSGDPVRLLFHRIPDACGVAIREHKRLLQDLKRLIGQLQAVTRTYLEEADKALRHTMCADRTSVQGDLRSLAKAWAGCFPDEFVESMTDQIAKGFLLRMQMPYDSDELLVNSLAVLLVGRPLARWDDSTAIAFSREANDVARRVEDLALAAGADMANNGQATTGLARLVTTRIQDLYARLVELIGETRASHELEGLERNVGKKEQRCQRCKTR